MVGNGNGIGKLSAGNTDGFSFIVTRSHYRCGLGDLQISLGIHHHRKTAGCGISAFIGCCPGNRSGPFIEADAS